MAIALPKLLPIMITAIKLHSSFYTLMQLLCGMLSAEETKSTGCH